MIFFRKIHEKILLFHRSERAAPRASSSVCLVFFFQCQSANRASRSIASPRRPPEPPRPTPNHHTKTKNKGEIQSAMCACDFAHVPSRPDETTKTNTSTPTTNWHHALLCSAPTPATPPHQSDHPIHSSSSSPRASIQEHQEKNCGKTERDRETSTSTAVYSRPRVHSGADEVGSSWFASHSQERRRRLPGPGGDGGGRGGAAAGGAEWRDAGADHREHRRLHRRHRGARPALRLPHRRLARRRTRRGRRRGRHLLLHASAPGMQRQAAGARNRGGWPRAAAAARQLLQLHLRRPGREVLRPDRQALHGGHHHPVPDRRHGRLPRLHRPEHLLRLRRRGGRWQQQPAAAVHRGARAAAAPAGGAVLGPLAAVARGVQHPGGRVHGAGRGHRGEAGPPAAGGARGAAVRGPYRGRGALGRGVRRRLRRVLLRGLLHDAGAGGVHGGPAQVPARAPPGHRRRHRRVRLLRRLRVPGLRRRHHGHHHAQPPARLAHGRRQGGAVRRAGADVPGDDAPDPRDRGGARAPAGRLAAAPRRRRRARRAARQPRRGARHALRGRMLRAGVRVLRVLRGEHRVRAALLRAARAVPPPRRRRRRRGRPARPGLGHPPLRARVRSPRPVRGCVAAKLTNSFFFLVLHANRVLRRFYLFFVWKTELFSMQIPHVSVSAEV
ncbi:hypothetical protein BS78_01G034100 [Paspalum vaginatum]|nr:hypothetical protein BS78_01G034100 [Paspalum vaginatum]